MSVPVRTIVIPLLMILAIAVSEMATDIYVPSLPYLTRYFSTSEEMIAATLSLNLWGFGIASAFYGPLSDAFGRKPILLWGLAIFSTASLLCGFATNIHWLILFRILQGIGGGVSIVVGSAVIKDTYDGAQCARIMSAMGIAIAVSPAMAPIIGGWVAEHLTWHWVFYIVGVVATLVAFSVLACLPETLQSSARIPFSFMGSVRNYGQLFRSLRFICYAMISALTFAGLWAYISSTPFYFINTLSYTKIEYGYFQGVLVFAYILGSIANHRLLIKFGIDELLAHGLFLLILSAGGLVFVGYLFPLSAYAFCVAMGINCFAMGIVFPNAVTRALEVFSQMKGISSALLSVLEMIAAGAMIWLTGIVYEGVMLPVTFLILGTSVLGAICFQIGRYRDLIAPRPA